MPTGKSLNPEKRVIETSYRSDREPTWLHDSRLSWEDGDTRMIRASYVALGSKRINGCYDLARAEAKELLLVEVSNDIRGELVRASQGLDETIDDGLTKSWIEQYKGDTRGFRFSEAAYERFLVNDVERIECFVLGRIRNSDYNAIRNRVMSIAANSNDRIRQAMEERQARLLMSGAAEPVAEFQKMQESEAKSVKITSPKREAASVLPLAQDTKD